LFQIYSTDEGSGLPVIFIHGFCEHHQMWDAFKKPFLKKYRVITIDLPGFGKSPLLSDNFSIKDLSLSVLEHLAQKKLEKFILIGHSLGGYVSLEMINQNPNEVSGLCLFHSTALADTADKKDARNKTMKFVEKHGVEIFAEAFVPSLFFNGKRAQLNNEIQASVKMAKETQKATLFSYTKAMRDRKDRTDVLKEFEGPILIIAGEEDTSVPIDKIQQQELLPKHGIVHYLDKCGHMGMFEKKEEITREIDYFLQVCS